MGRIAAAAFAMLATAWAQPGLAASAAAEQPGGWALPLLPPQTTPWESSPAFVNLDLGGVVLPVGAADSGSAIPVPAGRLRLDMGGGRDWQPDGSLLVPASALASTYLSAERTFARLSMGLADGLGLEIGYSGGGLIGRDSSESGSFFLSDLTDRFGLRDFRFGSASAKLSLNVTDWAAVAITASRSAGNPSLLGILPGSLGAIGTENSSLGISARVGFGEGWVTTLSFSEGVTHLDLNHDAGVGNPDSLRSQAYGIAIAKSGLFGADAFGVAVSQPLQVYAGTANFAGLAPNFGLTSQQQARESDVEFGYVTTFLDGTIALQANAAYQMNAAGAKGQNAVAGVARAKVNF